MTASSETAAPPAAGTGSKAEAADSTAATTAAAPSSDKTKATSTSVVPSTTANNARLENTTCCLPIVYGSSARLLPKKEAGEFQTHEWSLYLKSPNTAAPSADDKLQYAIQKVIFQLHASFSQPTRELTEPPYAVTERGWGEFEAQIRIVWAPDGGAAGGKATSNSTTEKPTVVSHVIRLYHPGTGPGTNAPAPPELNMKPVVAEEYEEVVFTDPTTSFFQKLQRVSQSQTANGNGNTEGHIDDADDKDDDESKDPASVIRYSDTEMVNALLQAQDYLKNELSGVKERLVLANSELIALDQAILEQQQKQQAENKKKAAAAAGGSSTKRKSVASTTAAMASASKKAKSKSGSIKKN